MTVTSLSASKNNQTIESSVVAFSNLTWSWRGCLSGEFGKSPSYLRLTARVSSLKKSFCSKTLSRSCMGLTDGCQTIYQIRDVKQKLGRVYSRASPTFVVARTLLLDLKTLGRRSNITSCFFVCVRLTLVTKMLACTSWCHSKSS